jgi:hypothetical protein
MLREEERRGEEVLRNEKGESNGRRGGAYVPVVVSVHPDDKWLYWSLRDPDRERGRRRQRSGQIAK